MNLGTGVKRKTAPQKNFKNANRDFLPRRYRSGVAYADRKGTSNALPLPYLSAGLVRYWFCDLPGNLAAMVDIFQEKELIGVRFVRFTPPLMPKRSSNCLNLH